jgi:hypothetical protein
MITQLTEFLCGPFFYPVFFASFLHAFDFFVISAAPQPPQSESRLPFRHSRAINSALRPAGYQSAEKTKINKENH